MKGDRSYGKIQRELTSAGRSKAVDRQQGKLSACEVFLPFLGLVAH